jgi:phosphatidylglycerol:prolipoprotein diacylglycerol transferase
MTDAYPWLITLGAIASLLWLGFVNGVSTRKRPSLSANTRLDTGLVSLGFGFLGARLGFILLHLHYFSMHANEIMKFWDGGLSWVGGAVGAILGLGIFALIKRYSFWQLFDSLALPAVILAFCAWFGCLLDGCAFGKPADFGLLTPLSPDNFGEQLRRWPVQSCGAILSLGSWFILNRLRFKDLYLGTLGTLSLTMISGINLILSFFRGDLVPILNGLRSDGIASAVLLVFGLIAFALRLKKKNHLE